MNVRVGFDTERNVHTGHSGTYASQFAVSGLSAVNGAARQLKAEIMKLAAFALQASEDDLEFGIGKQGPEMRVRGTEKAIPYIGLANLANVNTAVVPEELRSLTLNCRYTWRAPFQVPDVAEEVRQPDADLLVATAHRGHRDRQGDVHSEDSRLRGGRRLRHRDQPDDRRRPGPWRNRARHRRGPDGELRLRRERQHAGLDLQRLHADHRDEYAE